MNVEDEIRKALLDMSAVTDLTGSDSTTARIRPYKLAESDDKTEEHIVIDVDSEVRENDLDGLGGLPLCDVTVSCRAMTRSAANALAEAVRTNGTNPGTGLAGYGGSGTEFDSWLEDETPSVLRWDDGSDRKWHTVEMSFKVQYTETT